MLELKEYTKEISEYAATNSNEAIAEAVHDYYLNKDDVLVLLLKAANIPCDTFDFRIKDSDGVHEKLASVCPFYKIDKKWHMDCEGSLIYYDTKKFEVESFAAYVSYVCYAAENLDFTGTMVEFLPYSWGLEV